MAALSSVALLTLGGQWLIQRQLINGEADSRVINIAGRQRMLSQRLAKTALQLQSRHGDPSAARRELAHTLSLWASSHAGLREGDAQHGLPGENSPAVEQLFTAIEPEFLGMQSAAQTLLADDASPAALADANQQIQLLERPFLAGMDAIVSRYVLEAERKVAVLKRLEHGVLALTLAVLATEGLLIFRPAVRQIDRTLRRLNRVSQRLRLAKIDAEQADAAKSRFLANVSHELRTPMTAVLGMTELAREEHDPARRDKHLATVADAGELLLGLLNDLIDLARIDSGRLELQAAPFSPHEVLGRVVRMMRPACEAKGLHLAPLLAVDRELRVVGDARRLEQILLNLIGNSIKWTTEGAIYARCEVASIRDSRVTLRYAVQDTGAGISEAHQQHVFEPFAQVAGDKTTASGGVGLGLAICKRIADAMGAELKLTSKPAMGTTVSLIAEFEISDAEHEPAPAQPAPAAPLKILVVEDTPVNQVLLREHLTRDGHDVTVVGSGEEALRLSPTEHRFDAALIDLQLPGIDGVETAAGVRRLFGAPGEPLRLLCVTADARPSTQAGKLLEGFDAVITKPLKRDELRRELARVTHAPAGASTPPPQSPDESGLHQELAEAYLSIARSQEAELERALRERRWGDARVLAHRLRGQVGYFDAEALVAALGRLESACEAANKTLVDEFAPDVMRRLVELRERLPARFAVAVN